MTEEEARAICRELGATLSIRQHRGKGYIFASCWLPRAAAEAAGHQASSSAGQQFNRYVGPLAQLAQISPDTLKARIAALPLNPNKNTTKTPARPELAAVPTSPAFHELLTTIPTERILSPHILRSQSQNDLLAEWRVGHFVHQQQILSLTKQ